MRVLSFIKFYLVTIGLIFIGFSFINIPASSKFFLVLGVTFLSPYLFKGYLAIRGVRKGDMVLVTFKEENRFGFFLQKVLAKALQNGKIGDVIEIEINSRKAGGEIINYGGIFMPPEVNILYYEESMIAHEIH